MCLPKAPKMDPSVREAQERQKQIELQRAAEEKEKALRDRKRSFRRTGVRSLLSGSARGFGSNAEE